MLSLLLLLLRYNVLVRVVRLRRLHSDTRRRSASASEISYRLQVVLLVRHTRLRAPHRLQVCIEVSLGLFLWHLSDYLSRLLQTLGSADLSTSVSDVRNVFAALRGVFRCRLLVMSVLSCEQFVLQLVNFARTFVIFFAILVNEVVQLFVFVVRSVHVREVVLPGKLIPALLAAVG